MKVNKNLKKFVTMPNILFILASLMALSIVCKDSIVEGLRGMVQRAEQRNLTNNIVGDSQGGGDLPLGAIIAIIVVVIIIGMFFMKN